jgi:hypothetical protein
VPERWRIGTWAGAGRRPCCDVMRANVRRDFAETVGQLSLVAMPPGGAGSRGALRRVQWHSAVELLHIGWACHSQHGNHGFDSRQEREKLR